MENERARIFKIVLVTVLVLFAILFLIKILTFTPNNPPDGPGEKKIIQTEFICNMVNENADAVGIYGTDLGIGAIHNNKIWLLYGDTVNVQGTNVQNIGASALATSGVPFQDCNNLIWENTINSEGEFFEPIDSLKTPGIDDSTVPGGAIEINNDFYIFAQRITNWNSHNSPATGYGVLFKENSERKFDEITKWGQDGIHLNTAPVIGFLDGKQVIFMATTARYRYSPVYFSYVEPENIENKDEYFYLTGFENNQPVWEKSINSAEPLIDNVLVGEISFVYNAQLGKYLMLFADRKKGASEFQLYISDKPYGPYEKYIVNICGPPTPNWNKAGSYPGACYGGYIIPNSFGSDGKDIYITVSTWIPTYKVVVVKARLPDEM